MADPQGFSLPVESGVPRADSDLIKHSYDSEHTHSNTTHAYAYAPTPASVSGAGSAPPNPSPPDGRLVEENPDEAPLDSEHKDYRLDDVALLVGLMRTNQQRGNNSRGGRFIF